MGRMLALNFTIQDILASPFLACMQGRDVLWQPGTDHVTASPPR